MTTDIERLKRMALNAGAAPVTGSDFREEVSFDHESLARFAQSIAGDCAKALDKSDFIFNSYDEGQGGLKCAELIRGLYR